MKRNLYLLTIKKGYSCYVLATDPTVAQKELESLLDKAEWGFSDDRKVVQIKLLASELQEYPTGRPGFPEGLNCFIEAKSTNPLRQE